ncbi:MAG: hypothetical protein HQK51_20730, partial [Oligoflexia bacterium]|nr:hypothetical protein [Oligoflexia bacterium]
DSGLQFVSLISAFKISFIPLLNLLIKTKNIYWSLLFLSSIFDKRYISSIAIYSKLKKKLEGFNNNHKLITIWEGQPEHRAITAAFKKNGLTVYGYIHSSLSINPCFISKFNSENLSLAFPDKLFVHGHDYTKALTSVGWNALDVHVVKSQRYFKMNNKE